MRLTKLELNGFKSFARKTELTFGEGITAVIGPNGSGKSNIADAVRWVLGEQSAKALRGAKMEDVIFNGTQERRPQAFCEVMLTFDNSDGALPIEFMEVMITRRVYRSGESEYQINNNNCRLKDIHELFRDTGIGKEGYSIIGQGRVEEILSNKSGDRRTALEEAAGVMRYRARKEEAMRKLEHTKKNLERLEDILNELDAQCEPLYEQAEKAKEYLTLRDELKDLDINVFVHQYERIKERLEGASAAIVELQAQSASALDTEQALSRDCSAQEEELRAIEQSASELQTMLLKELSCMEAHAGEVSVLKERRENLAREKQRLTDERAQNEELCAQLREELGRLSGSGQDEKDLLKKLDEQIEEDEQKTQRLQKEIQAQDELVEEQKAGIIESLNRLSDAKAQLSRTEAMVAALNQRMGVLSGELQSATAERDGLLNEQNQAVLSWQKQAKDYEKAQHEKQAAQERVLEAKRISENTQAELHTAEQALSTMRSRSNVLEEMARAHEGYYASVRNVLRDCGRDVELRRCVLGVVAELVKVPRQYETAIEMSLGSALQNIVTPTPEHASRVIRYLRDKQYGRATLLPVSAMRPRVLNAQEREFLRMPGCAGLASELVEFDPQYKNVVENLLGRTVIVDTLETGVEMNKRAHAAFRIATIKGDIIHPGGSMTGGSIQKREFSLLGREREINELRLRMAKAQEDMLKKQRDIEAAANNVKIMEQVLEGIDKSLHAQDIDSARHKEKLDLIERDIEQNAQKTGRLELERGQIEDNLADIIKERQGIETLQSGIEKGSAATQDDVRISQAKLGELRLQSETLNQELTSKKVRRMAMQKEEDALLQEQKRLQRELEQKQQLAQDAASNIKRAQAQSDELIKSIETLAAQVGDEQAQVDTHKEQQQALEEERQRRAATLSETRQRKEELGTQLRSLEERRHKQELAFSRAELEFAAMQERISEDYGLTYAEALPLRRVPFAVTSAHVRIDELRTEIRELGDINVNAVEDYRALNERCQMMRAQCGDLHKAQEDLLTLIDELTGQMEKQFLSQFEIIQQNFSAVFEQLFEGGHAQLRLSDPKNPLSCDIDIIAQPPGKRLQLLTLLSGGERALTAIALLFAMLKLKPTVFCILDEIESSLDEVNVARFANYLKNYSEETQFILITHRKGSMEVCNTLYGVAMEEKGVSRLVSARLQDAS
ncbi:chromosome segregation protein SMC [Eubacteriales bacterium OttesenSCG-928-K08]|nr:chromosome segregation protein SMC [Eubacteriales bacterium OttesenSCG-928-K08]